jgi:hypothetical protein
MMMMVKEEEKTVDDIIGIKNEICLQVIFYFFFVFWIESI